MIDEKELLEYLDILDSEAPIIRDEFDAGWCEAVDQIREWIEGHQEGEECPLLSSNGPEGKDNCSHRSCHSSGRSLRDPDILSHFSEEVRSSSHSNLIQPI